MRRRWVAAVVVAAMALGVGLLLVFGVLPGDDDEPVPTNARAVFSANCVTLTAEDQSVSQAEATRYCGCLVTTLAKGRTGEDLNKLFAAANRALVDGDKPPAAAVAAAPKCAKQIKG